MSISGTVQSTDRTRTLRDSWTHRPSIAFQTGAPCSGWSVMHDLAALSEGHLSRMARRRLAKHLARCRSCQAICASLLEDSQADPSIDDQASSDVV